MSTPPYGQVDVTGAPAYNGLRVDHPGLVTATINLLKQGYSNEHIIRIVGVPSEVVDRERSKLNKQKMTSQK